jgi:DNA-binding winged helix-turn-helix (wHTH) protein
MPASRQLVFDPFRLDRADARLWRGTRPIALAPKAFALLQYLLERPHQLVTKEALLDAVWPATAVGEAVLKVCVAEIRRALEDSARAPRFIATVHRRGYRFLAPVTATSEPDPVPGASAGRSPGAGPGPVRLVGREAVLGQLQCWLDRAPAVSARRCRHGRAGDREATSDRESRAVGRSSAPAGRQCPSGGEWCWCGGDRRD